MDTPEHSDQILQKLSSIESQVRSLRYTFGIGIIILAVFLTFLMPALVRDFPGGGMWGTPRMMDTGPTTRETTDEAPPAAAAVTPAATTTP